MNPNLNDFDQSDPTIIAMKARLAQNAQPSYTPPQQNGGFLGNLVSGIIHPVAEFANGLINVPQAVYREVQGKPIDDIQQRVFGTTDPTKIAKKITGDTLSVASDVIPVGKGFQAGTKAFTKLGALGGFGSSMSAGGNTQQNLTSALTGGVTGGLLPGASKLLSKGAGITDKFGNNLISKIGGKIAPKDARNLLLQDTTNTLSNYGVKPGQYQDVANKVSDVLDPLKRRAVAAASPVDLSGLHDIARDAVGNEDSVVGAQEKKFMDNITKKLDNLGNRNISMSSSIGPLTKSAAAGTNNILGGGADPQAVFDTIKSLDKEIATAKGNNDPATQGIARAKTLVKNELEDRLYTGAGADSQVAKGIVTPNDISKLQAINPGNKKWNDFVSQVMGAQSVQDLRSAHAPFVKGSIIERLKEGNQQVGSDMGLAVKGLDAGASLAGAPLTGGASLVGLAPLALATNTGKQVIGSALQKTGNVLSKVPSTGRIAGTGGILAGQAAGSQIGQSGQSNSPDQSANAPSTPTGPLIDQNTIDQIQQQQQAVLDNSPGISGYTNAQLQQGLQRAVLNNDIKASTQIQNLIKMNVAGNKTQQAALDKYNAAQSQQINSTNDAFGYIQGIEQQIRNFGGTLGPIKGKLVDIPIINQLAVPQQKTYQSTLVDAVSAYVKAITGNSRPSAQQINLYMHSFPQITDTPTVAAQKLANLRLQLVNKAKNDLTYPVRAGDQGSQNLQNLVDAFSNSGTSDNSVPASPAQVQFPSFP